MTSKPTPSGGDPRLTAIASLAAVGVLAVLALFVALGPSDTGSPGARGGAADEEACWTWQVREVDHEVDQVLDELDEAVAEARGEPERRHEDRFAQASRRAGDRMQGIRRDLVTVAQVQALSPEVREGFRGAVEAVTELRQHVAQSDPEAAEGAVDDVRIALVRLDLACGMGPA